MRNKYTELNLQKLTPSRIDKMDYYKEALDFVFAELDILNIAITGPYGAGKSSVIKTYKSLHQEKKFIHISLTNFEQNALKQNIEVTNKEKDNNLKANKVKKSEESELEGKILNQLIYQINPKKIQQTKFKIKSDISTATIIKETLLMAPFLLFLLYIFKFNEIKLYIESIENNSLYDYLTVLTEHNILIFSIIICVAISSFYLFRIIKGQLYNPIFKKIKWKGNEIEIFENDDESYFNKHLDEILYLFRNSEVDAIVFEDIDRYDNSIIFAN